MKGVIAALMLLVSFTAWAEPKLTVVTEEYPPLNYTDAKGELRGIAVELAELLLKRLGSDAKIQLMSWPKAYSMATKEPNVLIFSLVRSERREDRFHWVGKIIEESSYLYQKRDRTDIVVSSLNDARRYRVGGMKRWDTTIWLTQNRVPVLELDQPWQGLKMMEFDKLDLMPFSELHLAYESARYGLKASDFMKVLKLRFKSIEFAMSKSSDPQLVKRVRQEFKKIRSRGEYQRIVDKYVYMDLYDKPVLESLRKPTFD